MAKFPTQKYQTENLFLLSINPGVRNTNIEMKFMINLLNTSELPHTFDVLKDSLPSIFQSECFNEGKLPFRDEVRNTEIGHLFEHILLEYLTKFKKLYDNEEKSFTGVTSWDWIKNKKGTFNIKINTGDNNSRIFNEAVEKSIELLKKIIEGKIN